MITKTILFFGLLTIAVSPSFAQLYMDAGKTVYEFDLSGNLVTSAVIDNTGPNGSGLSFGPDNRLYVSVAGGTARVDRFNSDLTGLANFVSNFQGGLFAPFGNTFGTDGNLYVASQGTSSIDRYFGPTSGTPGANDPSAGHSGAVWNSVSGASFIGIAFTPSGSTLYVSEQSSGGSVYAFDSTTGAFAIVASGLGSPNVGDIAINGTALYVRDGGQVKKFTINGDHTLTSAAFSINSTNLDGSYGLAFGPDGSLYATTRLPNLSLDPFHDYDYVMKIDPTTGNTVSFITGGPNDLTSAQNPQFLRFAAVPEPGTLTLAVIGGAAGFGMLRRRRKRHSTLPTAR